jgi:hypothetical protein
MEMTRLSRDISIYSCAGALETLITHPIEVFRTRYINRTHIWRGIRGVYPGVGIQLLGIIPNRIVFIGTKDIASGKGYRWWEYAPVATTLQTFVSVPFQSWRTAKIEGLVLRTMPYGVGPLYVRNLIFSMCLFSSQEELPKKWGVNSMVATAMGSGLGVTLSQPLDVIRVAKQSLFRDKNYSDIVEWLFIIGEKEGYIRTLWRGGMGRLLVASVGITTMTETTAYLKKIL